MSALFLFIVANILILLGGHVIACPTWLLTVSSLCLAWALGMFTFSLKKREKATRADLGQELTEMQKVVEKAARRYRSLLEGAGNAIFVFNADTGLLQEMNRKAAELFGTTKEEMANLNGKELIPPEEQEKIRSFMLRLGRRGRADAEGLTLRRKDGTDFQVEIDARVIELHDERVVHCIMRDITDKLAATAENARLIEELNWKNQELLRSHRLLEKASHNLTLSEAKLRGNLALVEQANQEMNRLDRMKNQFLGMVSHEFNTPLTSIISGAEFLLQRQPGEERAVVEMVRDGGLRLKELVADLLKLIRLEARGAELNKTPMHLHVLLDLLKEQYAPLLAGRRQTMRISELEELPFFDGDADYLERVFSELILNAIKFSPEGGEIAVTGRVLDREELRDRMEKLSRFNPGFVARCGERSFLEVEVRDNGIGIPPEELRRIFELFYEVGEIRHHSSDWGNLSGKGAGLGLAIVKGMVEAHGGMVWAESGQGSSFFLILPLEQETPQPALF